MRCWVKASLVMGVIGALSVPTGVMRAPWSITAARAGDGPSAVRSAKDARPTASAQAPRHDDRSCPPNMVRVEGDHCLLWEQVCLRWADPLGHPEARVCAEFQEPSRCIARRHPMRFCMDRDEHVAEASNVPTSGVSWTQARAACTALGKRLCTSAEWEFACEGEQGLPYPYGHRRSPSLCNQDRVERDSPSRAKRDLREAPHPSCVSPFGVRDMVGNVDEWVERPHARRPWRSELRGGWWMTGRNRCRAATTSHDERYAGKQTGFRCCSDLPR